MSESVLSLPRATRFARWRAPLLFLVALPIFLKFTFPYEALSQRLEAEATKAGLELTIGSLSGSGLFGLQAKELKIHPTQGSSPDVALDRLAVSPDLIGLVLRRIGFSFDADGFGGSAQGHARLSNDPKQPGLSTLAVDAKDLDLKSLPLQQMGNMEAIGKLSLKIDLPDLSVIEAATGSLSLQLKSAALLKAQATIPNFGALTLPKATLGDVDGSVTIDKGVARFEKFTARGGDIESDIDGTVRLKPLLSVSEVSLHVRLKFADKWLEANPIVKGMLGSLGPKQAEGYWITLTGPLSRPVMRPGK